MNFDWKKLRKDAGFKSTKEVADIVNFSVSTINGLENHGEGSERLKQALIELYAAKNTETVTEGFAEDAPVYRTKNPVPTPGDCVRHLQSFLETCGGDIAKLGWTLTVLKENFPLDKWKK